MEYIISKELLSEKLRLLVNSKILDDGFESNELEIFVSNNCNEEGEDYYIISAYQKGSVNELFESSGWGSIDTYEDLVHELSD